MPSGCSLYSVMRILSLVDFSSGRFLGVARSVEFFNSLSEAQSVCDDYNSILGSVVSVNDCFGVLDSVSLDCVTDFFPVCD